MKSFKQELPDQEWDERQRSRGGHMLQGRPWAQFQQALGRPIVWSEGEGWSWLGIVMTSRGGRYLYTPYGPTARSAKTFEAALDNLDLASRQLGVDFFRCEPMGIPQAAVDKTQLRSVRSVQPQHTLVLDLTKDDAELWKGVSSGHRNAINGAERRGVELSYTRDPARIQEFLQLIHTTANNRNFRSHSDVYYKVMLETLMPLNAATLGLAENEDRTVAAAIFLDYGNCRAYAHAGADPGARKLQAAAPLVWGAVTDARENGLRQFDLWGVAPEDASPDHSWAGFSKFKRGFGGEETAYPGTYELPIKAMKYQIYQVIKRGMGR